MDRLALAKAGHAEDEGLSVGRLEDRRTSLKISYYMYPYHHLSETVLALLFRKVEAEIADGRRDHHHITLRAIALPSWTRGLVLRCV